MREKRQFMEGFRGKIRKISLNFGKHSVRLALLCLAFAAAGIGLGIYAKATEVTASIVGYQDRASSGLRASQLLEVHTTGFSKDARLTYTYYNDMEQEKVQLTKFWTGRSTISLYRTYRTSDYSKGKCVLVDHRQYSEPLEGYKYLTLLWVQAQKGTVSVTVEDVNPDSRTYGKTAQASYTDFKESNLGYDLGGTFGMMEGLQGIHTIDLLDEGGVADARYGYLLTKLRVNTCETVWQSEPDLFTIKEWVSGNFSDFVIIAKKPGTAKIKISVSVPFNLLARVHFGQSGTGTMTLRIFKQPATLAGLRKITLSEKTEAGVTYTVNGESITCRTDGETLVFGTSPDYGPLEPDTEYEVVVSQPISGKMAKSSFKVWTANLCSVTYDHQGIGETGGRKGETVTYNTPVSYIPSDRGYDFAGWFDNPACTGNNYLTVPVTEESMTLYAKWQARNYRAELALQLDNAPYQGAEITLCQDGVRKYRLPEAVAKDGFSIYGAEVAYTVYRPDSGVDQGYDIWVNGKDSGYNFLVDGEKPDGAVYSQTLTGYRAGVRLTLDGRPWEGREVYLSGGSKGTQTLPFDKDTGNYELVFLYDPADTLPDAGYSVYVSREAVRRWNDQGTALEPVAVNVGSETAGNIVETGYYSVNAAVKKDGRDWTDTEVTLRQNGRVMKTLEYQNGLLSGGYRTEGIYDNGTEYGVFVKGAYTGEDSGVSINGTFNETINYYTVDYKDKSRVYYEQIVREGKNARKPVNPYKDGETFYGWYHTEKADGAPGDDLQYFVNGNTIMNIRERTEVWARWKTPSITLGDYVKCRENGEVDGNGSYYRFANLSVNGFPAVSRHGPVKTAVIEAEAAAAPILVNGSEDEKEGTFTCDGERCSYKVVRRADGSITIYFLQAGEGRNGWTVTAAQTFLREKIVIKPGTAEREDHTVTMRVFGVTAE